MCSTVQEQITTCGQNAIVKIGERTNIRPQKGCKWWEYHRSSQWSPFDVRNYLRLLTTNLHNI